MASFSPSSRSSQSDCMLGYVRVLTRPPVVAPPAGELTAALVEPWNVRIPVDTDDPTTTMHWREQTRNDNCNAMFDWEPPAAAPRARLHPYFSFSMQAGNPFFTPSQDIANCLKHLLLHRIGWHQEGSFSSLVSHDTTLFLSTVSGFDEASVEGMHTDKSYYVLRCHHDKARKQLMFGYHSKFSEDRSFQRLHVVSLGDEDWRLTSCVILKNIARILNCLKDYAVPLTCNNKLSVVEGSIQKIYRSNNCGNDSQDGPIATVTNMIDMYKRIDDVPHTDKLISAEESTLPDGKMAYVCRFAPIGRSYLPENIIELLEALVCVAEALVATHSIGVMHRDIRWANLFRAFENSSVPPSKDSSFSREWILFDFEFAALTPQPAFAAHSLTPGNHAPEMTDTAETHHDPHTTAVDIWGIGYLIAHAEVDIPVSHAAALSDLRELCMHPIPELRPSAVQCLDKLKYLQSLDISHERDIRYNYS